MSSDTILLNVLRFNALKVNSSISEINWIKFLNLQYQKVSDCRKHCRAIHHLNRNGRKCALEHVRPAKI